MCQRVKGTGSVKGNHDWKRLIEVDFPLEQVSLDSVHEKNVRHDNLWRGGRRATLGASPLWSW